MLAAPRRADMLAITFVISFLFVCGFYAYVFVHLEKERKRLAAHKKRLPEHLYEQRQEPESNKAADRDVPDWRPKSSITLKPKRKAGRQREKLSHLKLAARV
jgi:cbb3-type cytochrome oxidase subunit 3